MYRDEFQVQMKTIKLGPDDHISTLNIQETFGKTCASNEIHRVTVMWCAKHFMTRSTAASFALRIYLRDEKDLEQSGWHVVFMEKSHELLRRDVRNR